MCFKILLSIIYLLNILKNGSTNIGDLVVHKNQALIVIKSIHARCDAVLPFGVACDKSYEIIDGYCDKKNKINDEECDILLKNLTVNCNEAELSAKRYCKTKHGYYNVVCGRKFEYLNGVCLVLTETISRQCKNIYKSINRHCSEMYRPIDIKCKRVYQQVDDFCESNPDSNEFGKVLSKKLLDIDEKELEMDEIEKVAEMIDFNKDFHQDFMETRANSKKVLSKIEIFKKKLNSILKKI